ncbi:hypothetical protein ADM99_03635 [Leptolinea tardivitalis]|uniref:Uncharacterized protein n=2 Tax=Leptolinea tardivitalis TaxID=229920 RepID=A0A0P6XVB7_9CHLR|nr:hypothetical protein ADM99_03635 [Leptolinea tardivitalis]GAP21452.1 hypothetical protein LTAR_01663 [Leptolinea tardivitalis]
MRGEEMVFSMILVIIGVAALIKGEFRISKKQGFSNSTVRVLSIVLITGSLLGGFATAWITWITLIMVIAAGVFFLETMPEESQSVQDKTTVKVNSPSNGSTFLPTAPSFQKKSNTSSSSIPLFTGNLNFDNFRSGVDNSDTRLLDDDKTVNNRGGSIRPTIPVYSEFTVYNIRTSFSKKPGQPSRCPKCGGNLKVSVLQPSQSVRMDLHTRKLMENHRYSYLFNCEKCQWWCFRENWKSSKRHNYIFDFLVAGAITGSALSTNLFTTPRENPQPWMEALMYPDLYSQAENLPRDLARMFPLG